MVIQHIIPQNQIIQLLWNGANQSITLWLNMMLISQIFTLFCKLHHFTVYIILFMCYEMVQHLHKGLSKFTNILLFNKPPALHAFIITNKYIALELWKSKITCMALCSAQGVQTKWERLCTVYLPIKVACFCKKSIMFE